MPSLLRFFARDIGIDLGTGNTIISDANGNILVNEPSVVAIDLTTYEVLAVGIEAKNMLGKTPENIMAVRPLENGIIADFELTQAMLTFFVKKANSGFSVFQPRAMITVPSFLTDVEKRAVEDVVIYAGCRNVLLVEENIAAAIGMGLDINEPKGHLISNIGAGTIQSSIISLAGVVSSKSIKYGGDNVDRDIRSYIKKKHNLLVGNSTCEYIKNVICTLKNENLKRTTIISGKDLVTGMPKTLEIKAESLLDCVIPLVNETLSSIRDVLEKTPPEISGEIIIDGIVLCGGVSNLDGLAEAVEENVKIHTSVAENPINITGIGVGKALKVLSKKTRILIGNKDER
ncbi:rod shape-determining protein [Miniphocaeibacter massiliensis]|uniref:rod shape-determining protein n=1 Tax=Miniphocaeibacter massiliensis TaxID=2041841 RepID=UPI000C1BB01B|nr:rod shape-determining protein [Miniphocaeibacter massiliensis]